MAVISEALDEHLDERFAPLGIDRIDLARCALPALLEASVDLTPIRKLWLVWRKRSRMRQ